MQSKSNGVEAPLERELCEAIEAKAPQERKPCKAIKAEAPLERELVKRTRTNAQTWRASGKSILMKECESESFWKAAVASAWAILSG